MACPVCGGTEFLTVNVRIQADSSLKKAINDGWEGRNVARCNDCGVLYDHRFVESGEAAGESEAAGGTVNCPECGAPNDAGRAECSYCGASLA